MNVRRVGKKWTWFEDYVYATATYRCYTPPGRRVQVGMGVFFSGEPRGEKVAIKDQGEFTIVGLGAIHVRIYDDGPDCEIGISQQSNEVVPILRGDFDP